MQDKILIRGARENNLRNINVDIPRDKLVVLTGLSGSGKSSLAFDTLYAEGQRRYVESLSAYARQFLGQMQKPDVDQIDGLSPAIAIDQKTRSSNPRSTVGTVTEIYDYLRLLYARAGTTHCPECGAEIAPQSLAQIMERIEAYPERSRLLVMAPLVRDRKGEYQKLFPALRKDGFVRVRIDGEIFDLSELEDDFKLSKNLRHNIELVVDRIVLKPESLTRLADSLELALTKADGLVLIQIQVPVPGESGEYQIEEKLFSQNYACPKCNLDLGEISPRLFSFNNPSGACPRCSGLGEHLEIDPNLVVFDPDMSLNEGAIQAIGFNFADESTWSRGFIEALAKRYNFSLDTPYKKLPEAIKKIILYGNDGEKMSIDTSRSRFARKKGYRSDWKGVIPTMTKRLNENVSVEKKEWYSPYISSTPCPECKGARLRREALAVTVGELNIAELCQMNLQEISDYLHLQSFSAQKRQVAETILREILARLNFLLDVGLSYLSLSRSAGTLSGGESQRIRLATQIGAGLMGVLYILDEPSIGLHQRDNRRLLNTLKRLRDLGNTVVVVEHDEETIWEADHILDIGPGAGSEGGYLVAQGTAEEIIKVPESITGQYLGGFKKIPVPEQRRKRGKKNLVIKGCRENNLKDIDVSIPLGVMTAVTGVSGSGKSSLVDGIILNKLREALNGARRISANFDSVSGLNYLDKLVAIDQSPIGRTPRSNPATYTGAFDEIRKLFANTKEAKARGYKPGRFSFNVKGGRCEACKGDGVKRIEMHFLPDMYVECEICNGQRYKRETLEIKYKGKNIAEVLAMSVEEAYEFFKAIPPLRKKLGTLLDVGLGYISLGQPSTQLSGGEAQRVKLATELAKRQSGNSFYILDEPTTGLHSADVHRLVDILQRLTDNGNTVLVIEHNLDVIKTCDYIIDLGPEGGDGGGTIVAQGTPEELAKSPLSYTGQYLKEILKRK
ncbi:MAG: excinuclease ABC subunit UvrA [Eubacteriales bacterium]|nr:excinuclease ABC subunit UvrA [Eubacteriales bacterium]